MKKLLAFLAIALALSACAEYKAYDVQVDYFNGDRDTVTVYSYGPPQVAEAGALRSTTDRVYPYNKVESAGVRRAKVIEVNDLTPE